MDLKFDDIVLDKSTEFQHLINKLDIILLGIKNAESHTNPMFISFLYDAENCIIKLFNQTIIEKDNFPSNYILSIRSIISSILLQISHFKEAPIYNALANRITLSCVHLHLSIGQVELAVEKILTLQKTQTTTSPHLETTENIYYSLIYISTILTEVDVWQPGLYNMCIEFLQTANKLNFHIKELLPDLHNSVYNLLVKMFKNKQHKECIFVVNNTQFIFDEDMEFVRIKAMSFYQLKNYKETYNLTKDKQEFIVLNIMSFIKEKDSMDMKIELTKVLEGDIKREQVKWLIKEITKQARSEEIMRMIMGQVFEIQYNDKSLDSLKIFVADLILVAWDYVSLVDLRQLVGLLPRSSLEELKPHIWNIIIKHVNESDYNPKEVVEVTEQLINIYFHNDKDFLLLQAYMKTEMNSYDSAFKDLNLILDEDMDNIGKLIWTKCQLRFSAPTTGYKTFLSTLNSNLDNHTIIQCLLYLFDNPKSIHADKNEGNLELYMEYCLKTREFDFGEYVELIRMESELIKTFAISRFCEKYETLELKGLYEDMGLLADILMVFVSEHLDCEFLERLMTVIADLVVKYDLSSKRNFIELNLFLMNKFIATKSSNHEKLLNYIIVANKNILTHVVIKGGLNCQNNGKPDKDISYYIVRHTALETIYTIAMMLGNSLSEVLIWEEFEHKFQKSVYKDFIFITYLYFDEIISWFIDYKEENKMIGRILNYIVAEYSMFVIKFQKSITTKTFKSYIGSIILINRTMHIDLEYSTTIICNFFRTNYLNTDLYLLLKLDETFKNETMYLLNCLTKRKAYYENKAEKKLFEEISFVLVGVQNKMNK